VSVRKLGACMTFMRYVTWESAMVRTKAVTVRVAEQRLRRLMRTRRAKTPSELINTLLAEEDERLRSHRALRATSGTARALVEGLDPAVASGNWTWVSTKQGLRFSAPKPR